MIGALLVMLCAIVGGIWHEVKAVRRDAEEADAFIAKADEMLGLQIDLRQATEYKRVKREIWEKNAGVGKWDEDRWTEADICSPEEAWQRELSPDDKASLKAALIKRTLSVLPPLSQFQAEAQQKYMLHMRGLISAKQWASLVQVKQQLDCEALEIRQDAECLQPGYGFKSIVFKEAATFHHHIIEKQMQQLQLQRQREMLQHQSPPNSTAAANLAPPPKSSASSASDGPSNGPSDTGATPATDVSAGSAPALGVAETKVSAR